MLGGTGLISEKEEDGVRSPRWCGKENDGRGEGGREGQECRRQGGTRRGRAHIGERERTPRMERQEGAQEIRGLDIVRPSTIDKLVSSFPSLQRLRLKLRAASPDGPIELSNNEPVGTVVPTLRCS